MAESSDSVSLFADDYVGPAYVVSPSVGAMRRLPRFGHTSDFTRFMSSDQEDQADYVGGLVMMVFVTLTIFLLWTVVILTFKCMGRGNAGFLSGSPMKSSGWPTRMRIAFLVAFVVLVIFVICMASVGFANVEKVAETCRASIGEIREIATSATEIGMKLEAVGKESVAIRDAAVSELFNFCPSNPDLDEVTGVDYVGITKRAQEDLTMLANFVADGLAVLNPALEQVKTATDGGDGILDYFEIWGWETKLLICGLIILPSLLVLGVVLAMMGVDLPSYRTFLASFVTPLFALSIACTFVFCSVVLPLSAVNADVCTGSSVNEGGPDDTLLTSYRNIRGADTSLIFQIFAFYTQRCESNYYPYGFLTTYFDQLNEAVTSAATIADQISANAATLEELCGKSFDPFVQILQNLNTNLLVLQGEASESLGLIRCENINTRYVEMVHEALCTYSVSALTWTYATSFIVALCGMFMITLRAVYHPVEEKDASEEGVDVTGGDERRKSPAQDALGSDAAPPKRQRKHRRKRPEGGEYEAAGEGGVSVPAGKAVVF